MNAEHLRKHLTQVEQALGSLPKYPDGTITCEFELRSVDSQNDVATIIGGRDLSLKYHEIELVFRGIQWIDLPLYWEIDSTKQTIALVEGPELSRKLVHKGFRLFRMPSNSGRDGFLSAQQLTTIPGTCFHYYRKNLGENERIADWLGNAKQS